MPKTVRLVVAAVVSETQHADPRLTAWLRITLDLFSRVYYLTAGVTGMCNQAWGVDPGPHGC